MDIERGVIHGISEEQMTLLVEAFFRVNFEICMFQNGLISYISYIHSIHDCYRYGTICSSFYKQTYPGGLKEYMK